MKNKYLIFDFDGVIVDSFDVCLSVSQMYDPAITSEEYKRMFTGNIFDSIKKRELTKKSPVNFDFFHHYFQKIMDVPPIEGITELMVESKAEGISIVSSTDSKPIEEYLRKYDLGFIQKVLGGDVEKSKVLKLQMLKDLHPENELIFITDTLGDIIEATKIGIKTIGVTWGFHDRDLLKKGEPFVIVDDIQQLAKSIEK